MAMRPVGKKWSQFTKLTSLSGTATLNGEQDGQNVTITVDDFISQFPNIGQPIIEGDGTPVLEIAGSQYKIRSIESAGGLDVSVGATNNIQLRVDIENATEGGADLIVDQTASPLVFRNLIAGPGIQVAESGNRVQISTSVTPAATAVVVINTLADFPTPSGGSITLDDDTIYLIGASSVDISPNRLIAGNRSSLIGDSSAVEQIYSDVAGTFLTIPDGYQFSIENLNVNCPNAELFNLSSASPETGIFSMFKVLVSACDSIGTSNNAALIVFNTVTFSQAASGGVTFAGINSIISINNIFALSFPGTLLDFGSSVTTVVEVRNSVIVTTAPNKVFDGLPNSGNIAANGNGVIRDLSVIGTFDPVTNILPSDTRWYFSGSNIFAQSQNVGSVYMPTNATPTTFTAVDTPTKVLGTFTVGKESRFSCDTTGRITYTGVRPTNVRFDVNFTAQPASGSNKRYSFYIAKNGAVIAAYLTKTQMSSSEIESISMIVEADATTGDYFELWAENNTDTIAVTIDAAKVLANG